MSGLLEGVLPWAFSQGDRLKRRMSGLLSDPMGTMEQTAGLLMDKHREHQALQAQAFADPQRPFNVTDGKALDSLVGNAMGLLSVAPVGMTKSVGKLDEITGLPLNADGTVTVYHHTSKANADNILRQRMLKSAGEPHVYFTSEKNPVTGYGDTVVPVNVSPKKLLLDDEFPDGRKDFSLDVKRPGGFFRF